MKILSRFTVLALVSASLAFSAPKRESDKSLIQRDAKTDYIASISPHERKISLLEGEEREILLTLENRGRAVWPSQGESPVFLFSELRDRHGNAVKRNRAQFPLPQRLRPRDSLAMTVPVTAPFNKGEYTLNFMLFRKDLA